MGIAKAHSHPHCRRNNSPQSLQGVSRTDRAGSGEGQRAQDLLRAGRRLQSGGDGDSSRQRHHRAAEAQHDCQVHRHRQSGRWVLRGAGCEGE